MSHRTPDKLFITQGKEIERILRRAVRHALLEHKRASNSIAVSVDGRVVIIPPEEIMVEEPLTMGKHEKLLLQILRGTSDANIAFDGMCQLLLRFGFEERVRGRHHLFRKEGVEEKINLQREGSKAKPYQVRQVRAVILKYKLGGES